LIFIIRLIILSNSIRGNHSPNNKKKAKLAVISIGTIHRVIQKNGPVSKESRELIKKIMKPLNYKSNKFALPFNHQKGFIL